MPYIVVYIPLVVPALSYIKLDFFVLCVLIPMVIGGYYKNCCETKILVWYFILQSSRNVTYWYIFTLWIYKSEWV